MKLAPRLMLGLVALPALAGHALAQGVELRRDAVVYFGSGSNTTAPASIDEDAVRRATPEYRTIQSEGIRKGSARYKILVAEMDKRLRAAVRATVAQTNNDLVVRDGDVVDARGKEVVDITDAVVGSLADAALQAGLESVLAPVATTS